MVCGTSRRRITFWSAPDSDVLKFNVDTVARGKHGPTGIGGVLYNDKGEVLCLFFKGVGVRDSNEAGVLAILEALRIFYRLFQRSLFDCGE